MKKVLYQFWRILYPMLIYFAVSIIVEGGIIAFYFVKNMSVFTESNTDVLVSDALNYVVTNGLYVTTLLNIVLIPVYAFFLHGDNRKRKINGASDYEKPNFSQFILIAVFGITSAIGVNGIVSLSGIAYFSDTYEQVAQMLYSGGIFVEILSAAILAPLVEELLFRGMIYKRLRDNFGFKVSMLVSAVIFGAFHGNLVQFVYAFIIGCILAYVYEKFKTVWAPIVFHMSANLVSVLLTELVPEEFITIGVVITGMVICLVGMAVSYRQVSKCDIKEIKNENIIDSSTML